MRRMRAVSLVVTIVVALFGTTMVSAQAAPTSEEAGPSEEAAPWEENDYSYSFWNEWWADSLNRCITVTETGIVRYDHASEQSADLSSMVRRMRNPRIVNPITVVRFYDTCEPERTLKPLDSARVQLTTAWMDNKERFEWRDALSVSYPWGISFTPGGVNGGYHWAQRTFESNTVTTAKFTITTTGTAASWEHLEATSEPYVGEPVYPSMKMTNELHSLVVHSGDKTQSFAANQLPKFSFRVYGR